MKQAERMSRQERNGQYSSTQDEGMACLSKAECSDATDKNVPDSKIEKAPQDIDC
jgi:hypothetical protein